jgi:hypothetical protein
MQIKLSPLGNQGVHKGKSSIDAEQAWPDTTSLIQGGLSGIVFNKGGSYRTAFVEAFLNNSFYRGEGATIEEAELACWNKYKASIACLEHEWEARGYTNGAGFCKKCNKFESHRFTGEQLGLFCGTCGVGTTYSQVVDTTNTLKPFCKEHVKEVHKARFAQLTARKNNLIFSEEDKLELSGLTFLLGLDDDDE